MNVYALDTHSLLLPSVHRARTVHNAQIEEFEFWFMLEDGRMTRSLYVSFDKLLYL